MFQAERNWSCENSSTSSVRNGFSGTGRSTWNNRTEATAERSLLRLNGVPRGTLGGDSKRRRVDWNPVLFHVEP
jgi:hypothetical protein